MFMVLRQQSFQFLCFCLNTSLHQCVICFQLRPSRLGQAHVCDSHMSVACTLYFFPSKNHRPLPLKMTLINICTLLSAKCYPAVRPLIRKKEVRQHLSDVEVYWFLGVVSPELIKSKKEIDDRSTEIVNAKKVDRYDEHIIMKI